MAAAVARIAVLFVYAFLFAAVEIEIEGAHGWAERLPTWRRRRTPLGRFYGLLMEGKPLTGYHAFMFVLSLASFHLPFVWGAPWSLRAEAEIAAAYPVWVVCWDFLWFLLNPAYGWARFRRGEIWWMNARWLGRMPIEYAKALGSSIVIAAGTALLAGDRGPLVAQGALVAGLGVLTLAAGIVAPAYHRWYAWMRRPGSDEIEPPTV